MTCFVPIEIIPKQKRKGAFIKNLLNEILNSGYDIVQIDSGIVKKYKTTACFANTIRESIRANNFNLEIFVRTDNVYIRRVKEDL